jgi:integrase
MRFPKPFFRESKAAWYVQFGRRQFSLGPNRKKAFRRYKQLLLHERGKIACASSALTVSELADVFLEWSKRHNDARTYEWYKMFLQDFCDSYGALKSMVIRPFHVTRWLDSRTTWAEASRRCATIAVKRAFNWAEGEGLIKAHSLKGLKKGPPTRRERVLTGDEREQIVRAARGRPFKDFLQALEETGCRPSEIAKVTAANVNLSLRIWVLPEHKTRKRTGRPRIVYLTPTMLELTRKLVKQRPEGPLFLNSRRKPWTRNALRCRFRNLRRKHPNLRGVVSYTYRHSFVTDALANGCGLAQVAELVGHSSTETTMHYQHLSEKRLHMLDAAQKATAGLRTA